MTINDTTVASVFGANAGIYAGTAIPSVITNSALKFIVIPIAEAHAKATLATTKTINPTLSENDYNTATDVIALMIAASTSYTTLNAKPTDLRKFSSEVVSLRSVDDGFFETGVTNLARQFTITLYEPTTIINDYFNPSVTVLS